MPKGSNNIKVGALTMGGTILFLLVISFLGVFNFMGGGYEINVIYDQVNGLKPGNEVRFAGVNVGKVKDIKVKGSKIKAILKIGSKDVKIPEDSVFSIGVDGVMGAKFVTIDPTPVPVNTYVKDGQEVQGTRAQGLDEFMASSAKVIAKLDDLADDFKNVFGDAKVQASLRRGLINSGEVTENLANFTKVMADIAEANKQDIQTMMANMNAMTAKLNDTASHLQVMMEKANNNGETGKHVAEMAENLANASRRLENTVKGLENVITDPKTQTDLKETVHNVKETTSKANRILGTVTNAKAQADVMYNGTNKKWRTDAGVNFPVANDAYFYVGGADIGGANKLDLHIGKDFNKFFGARAGIMMGEFGVGVNFKLGKNVKLFTDFYDFNEHKWRVGAEVMLCKNLSLIGQTMNMRKDRGDTTFLGIRAYF